ncbi:MAG: asparagine synthase (glutamine-hydrolyzing) [Planctomycetota bacterium]|nr:asparagine synthase (glutamine-hydrolyzing) [Planctomycetota bacterium]
MVAAIAHRGPDDAGCHPSRLETMRDEIERASGVALGFRRLSIIDLGGGHQPMSDATGRFWVVFNGEIYNYRELRQRLEGNGHVFRTSSDTEVLLEAYKAFGTDCVMHLRGMFAFAIWDGHTLFLARDRLGQKPLFYREENGRLLFASELKSLLQVDDAPRELDATAIDDFLTYQYVPYPKCVFRGYAKLPPGHAAVYEGGRLKVSRYWSPPFDRATGSDEGLTIDPAETARWSPSEWRSELRRRLTEAVRLRLRSDVPLGAFLSGGVDSTIIAGLMQQVLREEGGQRAMTFSIGFPVAEYDERKYARQAAEHLGTDHHEQVVDPDAMSILPRLVWHYDEPFADSSAVPTMILSEFTRRHVTVALSGDGGDELFCGYDRYKAVRLALRIANWPKPIRAMLASPLWQKLPASTRQRSFRRRLKRFVAALAAPPERQYLRWIGTFDSESRARLYTPEFAEQVADYDSFQFLSEAYAACPEQDFITRTTCVDTLTYLPCDILTKVDIASMAVGLEARSPFLDHQVAELAALMPIELKQTAAGGKRILIETFSDLLPHQIQSRPKMGFGVPLAPWFRGSLNDFVKDVLLDRRTSERGLFRRDELERYIAEHTSGRWDHGYRLWTLLIAELWMRTWVDAAVPPIEQPVGAPVVIPARP